MFGALKFSATFCTVLISICQAQLHPPTNLTYEWLDALTVNMSWSWNRPGSLSRHCHIKHEVKLNEKQIRVTDTHYRAELLTEDAAKWMCSVRTVGVSSVCMNHRSEEAKLVIEPLKPPAAAVLADFRCLLSDSDMNCSWTSHPSSPVSLLHRECGPTKKLLRKGFSNCSLTFKHEEKTVCSIRGNYFQKDICMVATTPLGIQTFKAKKGVKLPHLDISEQGTSLVLTWAPLAVHSPCFRYNICYSTCEYPTFCRDVSAEDEFLKIPFDENCQYTFQYRVHSDRPTCVEVHSVWSQEIHVYGVSDPTLKVVAVVMPLFVSFCVILSCICFRRHKNILFPEMPDPSAIFKEMIKPNISTYVPVQEPYESILIVPHIPDESEHALT